MWNGWVLNENDLQMVCEPKHVAPGEFLAVKILQVCVAFSALFTFGSTITAKNYEQI